MLFLKRGKGAHDDWSDNFLLWPLDDIRLVPLYTAAKVKSSGMTERLEAAAVVIIATARMPREHTNGGSSLI